MRKRLMRYLSLVGNKALFESNSSKVTMDFYYESNDYVLEVSQ